MSFSAIPLAKVSLGIRCKLARSRLCAPHVMTSFDSGFVGKCPVSDL